MAVLMSSLLRPVAEAAREKNLVPSLAWAPYLTSSVKASIKGWAKVPMSNSLSSPLPMPSMLAKARKMSVKVDGKREHLRLRQRLQVGADGRSKKRDGVANE